MQNGELTERLEIRISRAMKAELIGRAQTSQRSPSAIVRSAIRSYLAKGKR